MMKCLNVYKSGKFDLSDGEYQSAEGLVAFSVHFDTEDDAKLAISVLHRFNYYASPNARVNILETEIDEYRAINKRLADRIDGLLAHQQVSMNYANAATDMLRRICNSLAVGTIAQATHRERNEVSRNIVHSIINFLKTPVDVWLSRQMDMEDIPF